MLALQNNVKKDKKEAKKMKKLTKKALRLMILVGFMVCGVSTVSAFPQPEMIGEYSQYINESFTASIDEIEIDTASYPIFIENHNSNEILVTADIENSSSENPLTVQLFGGTLKITQKQNARKTLKLNILLFRFRSTPGTGSIVVKVPIDSSYAYDVDNKGGDVHINSLTTSSIDVSTDGGDIEVEKISPQGNITFSTDGGDIGLLDINSAIVSSIDIRTDGGDITAEKISSQGNMIFRTDGGDIDLTNGSANSIDVITDSGRITLEQITCTDITIEGTKEDIEFSDLNAQNIIIDSSSGDVRGSIVGNSRDFSVTRRTRSGSNNLSNQAGLGSKMLNVSTGSGDIYISFME